MPEQSYRPLILQVSWRRMIILLTSLALALSAALTIAFGATALKRLHFVLALGFAGVFGAAVVLFVVVTLADKHLWIAALNAGINKLLGFQRSIVGAEALVGRTAVVVSALLSRPTAGQLVKFSWEGRLGKHSLNPTPCLFRPLALQ